MTIQGGDIVALFMGGLLESYTGSGGTAPDAPTIMATASTTTITVGFDGDAGATNYLYYKLSTAAAWTAGGSRSGDGNIVLSGLAAGAYDLIGYSSLGGLTSLPSNLLHIHATAATSPILERIADDICDVINSITIASGYNQTLTAFRSKRSDYDDTPPDDGVVLIVQDERPDASEQSPVGKIDTEQLFLCIANVVPSDGDTTPVDTLRNRVYADMVLALMADTGRGSTSGIAHAIDTRILPQVNDKTATGECVVIAPVVVTYRTDITDPYQH